MTKKTLPKAIRPGVVRAGASDPDPRISEPLPEGASYSAARQASSVSAMDVTEIAAGERKARARKLVERFSLLSGVAGVIRRCYLRDRHGFHRAFCFGRDAA